MNGVTLMGDTLQSSCGAGGFAWASPSDANRTVVNSVKVVGLDSRAYLQEAEILLSEFRHQVRSDLRERVQHDKLTSDTVKLLKQQLKEVREAVLSSLRS